MRYGGKAMSNPHKPKGDSKTDVDAQIDLIASGNPQYHGSRIGPLGRKAKALPRAGVIFNLVAIIIIIIWIVLVVT